MPPPLFRHVAQRAQREGEFDWSLCCPRPTTPLSNGAFCPVMMEGRPAGHGDVSAVVGGLVQDWDWTRRRQGNLKVRKRNPTGPGAGIGIRFLVGNNSTTIPLMLPLQPPRTEKMASKNKKRDQSTTEPSSRAREVGEMRLLQGALSVPGMQLALSTRPASQHASPRGMAFEMRFDAAIQSRFGQ